MVRNYNKCLTNNRLARPNTHTVLIIITAKIVYTTVQPGVSTISPPSACSLHYAKNYYQNKTDGRRRARPTGWLQHRKRKWTRGGGRVGVPEILPAHASHNSILGLQTAGSKGKCPNKSSRIGHWQASTVSRDWMGCRLWVAWTADGGEVYPWRQKMYMYTTCTFTKSLYLANSGWKLWTQSCRSTCTCMLVCIWSIWVIQGRESYRYMYIRSQKRVDTQKCVEVPSLTM